MTSLRCRSMFLSHAGAFLVGGLLVVNGQLEAATIHAASVSLVDVSAAVASAADGDTVVLPAGTASWAQTLNISKSITLRGANINATDDLTVILDGVVLTGNAAHIIRASISPTQSFRVSGITFRLGSRTTGAGEGGAITVTDSPTQTAPCTSLRIDHCHFDRLNQMGIRVTGWFYGVIDHCQWDTAPTGNIFSMNISAPTWGGASNVLGNGSWADPSYFGTEKFIFVEDCVFNNNAHVVTSCSIDSEKGGRYVFRHNTFKNTWPGQHGTESGGYRGGRTFEVYNNTFDFSNGVMPLSGNLKRSGTSLIHDNIYKVASPNPHINNLTVYRENGSSWLVGGASGANVWDVNATTNQTNKGFGGGPSALYASGTYSGATNSTTLAVSGTPWTANQWVGYSVTNLNQKDRKGFNVCSLVTSNTANTMSFSFNGTGTQLIFNAGDKWELRRVIAALDQPGRGQGDLVALDSNGNPYNTRTGNAGWPNEKLEPLYCWNNSFNGKTNDPEATVSSTIPTVIENRDYYNFNPSWQAGQALTTGIASGTLANRPKTCTPGKDVATGGNGSGVGYWATDTKTFYVCTAASTWTSYYSPYIYPHPLVSGAPAPLNPPTNLHVIY
jgi:hypothetical protein